MPRNDAAAQADGGISLPDDVGSHFPSKSTVIPRVLPDAEKNTNMGQVDPNAEDTKL